MCKDAGVEHIAISTNGSFSIEKYEELIHCGFNDFSISLDACCAATGDKMAGGIRGAWAKVVENIAAISKKTYVTVGIVLTDDNVEEMVETVEFAHGLGVADIRIISSAQSNAFLAAAALIPDVVLDAHPILKYRVNNIAAGRHVRGLCDGDSSRCGLVIDDIAAVGGYHFPCIIYLREGGKPIGKVGPEMRQERLEWFKKHCSYCDPICKKNCLDVCIDYNNKFRDTHK
jgi:MoaA/NifB/PqqE/SkfB family radical SAM enzyme